MFQRELGRVSVGDFNASFRGEIYGQTAVDADWFAEHAARNGIDLARSPRWAVGGALGGMALLAFRGERAWVGAFGVVPELRGRGYARAFLADVLALARAAGAASLELEVLERNAAAVALYERGGFTGTGELIVWKRAPVPAGALSAAVAERGYDAAAIARIARRPSTCWQREPSAVAAAVPLETLLVHGSGSGADDDVPAGYAFVRRAAARVGVVDAGARDAAAAAAVLAALDAHVPQAEPVLINEPPDGPLHAALAAHPAWSELARQRRMVAPLG